MSFIYRHNIPKTLELRCSALQTYNPHSRISPPFQLFFFFQKVTLVSFDRNLESIEWTHYHLNPGYNEHTVCALTCSGTRTLQQYSAVMPFLWGDLIATLTCCLVPLHFVRLWTEINVSRPVGNRCSEINLLLGNKLDGLGIHEINGWNPSYLCHVSLPCVGQGKFTSKWYEVASFFCFLKQKAEAHLEPFTICTQIICVRRTRGKNVHIWKPAEYR